MIVRKRNRIINTIEFGDCIEIMKRWADVGVQVNTCVTSPPYFNLRDYHTDGQIGHEETPQEYVEKIVEVFRNVRNILRDDGTVWLNIADSYCNSNGLTRSKWKRKSREDAPANDRKLKSLHEFGLKTKDLMGIPWRLAFALQKDGWYLRQDIIWNKKNPMPELIRDRCCCSHEYVFLLSKNPKYYYDFESIKEETVDGKSKKNKRDVWSVSVKKYKSKKHKTHCATFPPDLITPCILAGCPVNGIVFDHFMGSGTTAMVAKNNNRNYLGCELNREYEELQIERITS